MRHVLLDALLCLALAGSARPAEKKLIEFGWDEPDPGFMAEHAGQLEGSPFHGCVFHVDARKPEGGRAGSFTWEAWGTRQFTAEELAPALKSLREAKLSRFKHNFLRFNTTPAKLDWFDNHAAVIGNAELAARFARESGCPGLLFDIEQYDGPLFNYRKQRDAATKSWDAYAAQVRARGREVMAAFQRGYPGLEVFLTFGYSLPWAQCGGKREKLPDADYGLLAPFMDGLVDAAEGKTRLIDGHELSYGYKQPEQFVRAINTMRTGLLPIVADTNKYAKVFSFSFGLWMDQNWRRYGWDTNDFSKNYFTPESFRASLGKALELADEYVWIYTETPRWWSQDGVPVKLPSAYDAAVRNAGK